MKTCIFDSCYLDGVDMDGKHTRMDRYIKFLNYYLSLKPQLGFQDLILADNGSNQNNIQGIQKLFPTVQFVRFATHLERGPGLDYPYGWRFVYYARNLIAAGYDKIMFLDSDFFVLTSKMAAYVNNCNSGYVAFWSEKYNFPEPSLSILNKDAFQSFMDYTDTPWQIRNGSLMEVDLPFTKIEKSFNGDRFGENRFPQRSWMDYYGQCDVDIKMTFV